jgi:hydrogenase expression/formation protein HypE
LHYNASMSDQVALLTQNQTPLAAGKLPPELLDRLFEALPTDDPQLLLGPSVGEDAAVIDLGGGARPLLVVKSDPITFATDEIGFYAVNVCANDLAVTGAEPRFFLPTLLLPAESATVEMAESIFRQIGEACRSIGIVIVGGHSEITHAVRQPVVAGTMLGEVDRCQMVRSSGCQVDDLVMLAGTIPVEGASIIAREREADLLARSWAEADIAEAANYLFSPGISVTVPALAAARAGLVTAMHDPTEGGVTSALAELATAAGVGMTIDLDAIPVPVLAERLCQAYGLNPLGTIASGALLATCKSTNVDTLLQLWRNLDWSGVVIGCITPASDGLVALRGGETVDFPSFSADEITKLFAE